MPVWTFIRHGQSIANANGWFAGQRDAPLTERGREQAETARAQTESIAFDRALCSDLSRAHETAQRILRGRDVPLHVTRALRERTCGNWEGRAIAELESAGVMQTFAGWDTHPGGGESLHEVARRVCQFFAGLEDVPSTLVVSHGALMRAVIGTLDRVALDVIGAWRPKNCQAVRRSATRAQWQELASMLDGGAP